jgi:hypothetical protein
MSVVRWRIFDPDTDTTWVFPMNPKSGALPARQRNIAQQAVSAVDSKQVLLFEGSENARTISWDGMILTEQFYLDILKWFDTHHQVRLTDDLGQTWWVYLTKFNPKRVNKHSHPWAMTYDVECLIIDWALP